MLYNNYTYNSRKPIKEESVSNLARKATADKILNCVKIKLPHA